MKSDTMRNILPILNKSKYTLCFNWKDNKQLQVDTTNHLCALYLWFIKTMIDRYISKR